MFSPKTHNGFVTVKNTKTGKHRVMRIWSKDFGGDKKRVAGLLTGRNRDVNDDWTDFAFVGDDGRLRVWKRHRGTEYDALAKILEHVERGEELGLEYHIEGRCRLCNRELTDPESISTGIGPVCAKK